MNKGLIKNIDYVIIVVVLLLVTIGIIGIYSAGYNSELNKTEYIKQLMYFGIMSLVVIAMNFFDYSNFKIFGYIGYGISLILLVIVLFMPPLMGAKSWFNFGFMLYQPSELMKIAYILCLAKVFSYYDSKVELFSKDKVIKMLITIGLFIVPVILIMLQPDFGTAIVYVVITLFMLYSNGIKYRYIFGILAVILISIPIIYMFVLNPVQKERIEVFLNPELDPLDSGYNAIQSKMAVGSGMILGTGYLQGTQTQYGYIPIKSSDFIYSVLSEELGFFMSVFIIILFAILLIRMFRIASNVTDTFAKYIVIGISGMIFFHFVQNIGMSIGLLPITGVPLPFVSYGGSNLITNMLAIGIVLNISARRNAKVTFV